MKRGEEEEEENEEDEEEEGEEEENEEEEGKRRGRRRAKRRGRTKKKKKKKKRKKKKKNKKKKSKKKKRIERVNLPTHPQTAHLEPLGNKHGRTMLLVDCDSKRLYSKQSCSRLGKKIKKEFFAVIFFVLFFGANATHNNQYHFPNNKYHSQGIEVAQARERVDSKRCDVVAVQCSSCGKKKGIRLNKTTQTIVFLFVLCFFPKLNRFFNLQRLQSRKGVKLIRGDVRDCILIQPAEKRKSDEIEKRDNEIYWCFKRANTNSTTTTIINTIKIK